MSDDNCAAVPLIEQLRSVPLDAVLRIDTPNALGCMDTRSIPVGRLCHEAAYVIQPASTPPQYPRPTMFNDKSERALEVGFRILDSGPTLRELIDGYVKVGVVWSIKSMESIGFGTFHGERCNHPAADPDDQVRIYYWLGNSNLYHPCTRQQWLDAGGELPSASLTPTEEPQQ